MLERQRQLGQKLPNFGTIDCGSCARCLESLEIFHPSRGFYGFGEKDISSMASYDLFLESFIYKVPSSTSKEVASALMRGGAIVFNALNMFSVKSTERVVLVGVRGLSLSDC